MTRVATLLGVLAGCLLAAGVVSRAEAPAVGATRSRTAPGFDDFLGAEACAECHADEYRIWRGSTHGNAGGAPGEVEVFGRFDGTPLVFRDGVVIPHVTPDGRYVFDVRQRDLAKQKIEVAAVVGGRNLSGGSTQTYFARFPDGTLRFLPFDWSRVENTFFVQLRRDNTWVPVRPDVALADLAQWPPHRILGNDPQSLGCLDCHGSQILVGKFEPERGRPETVFKSLRINCESCHGPGRRHVELVRSPDARRLRDIGMEPLELLSKDRSLQVCFNCHAEKNVLRLGHLPGRDFEDYYSLRIELLRSDLFLPDGKVRDFAYQQNHLFSDCYVDGSMVCVDCHDPHSQAYRDIWGKPLAGKIDDGQCTDCHASKASNASRHTHHSSDSAGSRCVACHMPLLQHRAVGTEITYRRADHTVSIPRPEREASFGIEGACQQCHRDRTPAQLQRSLDAWWGPVKPSRPAVEALLRARDARDRREAASLLLMPADPHLAWPLVALSQFVRGYLAPDMPALEPEIVTQLEQMASSTDLDRSAMALAALHLSRGQDPAVRRFLTAQLGGLGERGPKIRARWKLALEMMAGHFAGQGRADEARATRRKAKALAMFSGEKKP